VSGHESADEVLVWRQDGRADGDRERALVLLRWLPEFAPGGVQRALGAAPQAGPP
jgi:hypothetical protein